ncbi:MAG: Verru_Chthon cassette protein C [Candidatus Methylacidiphilales bacterium]
MPRSPLINRPRRRSAFTIAEVLVAVTLLLIIMAVTATVMDQATRAWRQTNTKIEAFQNARGVFEVMTSRLTPATLNTYLDYYDTTGQAFRLTSTPATFAPAKYGRYSDLHFICGAGKTLVTTLPPFYSQVASGAVFFVAPTGLTATADYRGTTGLLNASGFFIAFGSDKGHRPPYLTTPETYRWRLMELSSPTESLEVFGAASGNSWFRTPISTGKVRPVADNVIALIIWPRRPPADDAAGTAISSNYAYDSRTTAPWASGAQPVQAHQLPPTLQVTMVVIDDGAARRLDKGSTPPPEITAVLGGLFNDNAEASGNLVQHYETDLKVMEQRLIDRHIGYRVFSSTISLREAKWTP